MLQLTPQSRIFVATEPVDFRKGIDGLAAVCRRADVLVAAVEPLALLGADGAASATGAARGATDSRHL